MAHRGSEVSLVDGAILAERHRSCSCELHFGLDLGISGLNSFLGASRLSCPAEAKKSEAVAKLTISRPFFLQLAASKSSDGASIH